MPRRPGAKINRSAGLPAGPPAAEAVLEAISGPAMTRRLWGLLLLLGFLWGGSFFFTQIAVREMAPLPLVAVRVGLAALALTLLLLAWGTSLTPIGQRAGAFMVLGVLNNAIPFSLLAIGQREIGAGLASILNATTPLWTILIAALATSDERLSLQKVAGILCGILGVTILVAHGLAGFGKAPPVLAFVAILGATLSYAAAAVFAKRFKGVAPTVVATGQLLASSLVMIPLALVVGGGLDLASLSGGVVTALAALALVSTALAYILYFEVVAKGGATNASLVTFLVPASAVLLGIFFLGEEFSSLDALGFSVILIGLAAVDGRIFERFRKRVRLG